METALQNGPPREIVLLYNDRERAQVEALYRNLRPLLRRHGLRPWMAHLDMSARYSLFENIERAIKGAVGSIICVGPAGLGRFLKHIELMAVSTERWLQGSGYGVLVACLNAESEIPESLLGWSSVNHDGSCAGTDALALAILQRFGLSDSQVAA